MKKIAITVLSILATATIGLCAQENANQSAQPAKTKLTPEKKAELKKALEIRRGGPRIPRPGTLQGKSTIVNAQKTADAAWLQSAVEYLRKDTNFAIDLVDGKFTFPSPKVIGGVSLYVIDDLAMPRVLAAPEDRWCMMNVAPLKSAKPVFFEARVKKELSRAFAMLCGGMTSNYGISLVGAVTKSEDLDVFPDGKLPLDVIMRMEPYMTKLGIVPAKLVPYRIACQEGWAPQPRNDVERAVWNQVHQIPDKPMTIEFDPKRDKDK